jgi:hypothetical protein
MVSLAKNGNFIQQASPGDPHRRIVYVTIFQYESLHATSPPRKV